MSRSNTGGTACANSIRGICAGGGPTPRPTTIEYVNIASTGNGIRFGDLINTGQSTMGAIASSTRGLITTRFK